jgi:hypothetical protein
VVRVLAWAVCCTLLGWSSEDSQQILCSPPVWSVRVGGTPMGHECLPQQQPKQACACVLRMQLCWPASWCVKRVCLCCHSSSGAFAGGPLSVVLQSSLWLSGCRPGGHVPTESWQQLAENWCRNRFFTWCRVCAPQLARYQRGVTTVYFLCRAVHTSFLGGGHLVLFLLVFFAALASLVTRWPHEPAAWAMHLRLLLVPRAVAQLSSAGGRWLSHQRHWLQAVQWGHLCYPRPNLPGWAPGCATNHSPPYLPSVGLTDDCHFSQHRDAAGNSNAATHVAAAGCGGLVSQRAMLWGMQAETVHRVGAPVCWPTV